MAKPQQWGRIKELFGAALELDPTERAAFLRDACGTDQNLKTEIESLLAAHDQTDLLSSSPWQDRSPLDLQAPKSIGPYQLIRKLGEGGMGQVWLAEQTAPVRRQVALKLIRAGMFDESLLHRFQSERQSLAMMDHPAIAKVFEAGSTPEGQPYLAMEYVPGLPITEYCDEKKLPVRERLELFIKACEGIQHAHQKAIIHRDLKPANILVVEIDGKPAPRIIDFGLAKTITPLTDNRTAVLTQAGVFLGTPGYMSPEQADPEAQDIDTRTDVYSLGVVLYVLLTGLLPFDTKKKAAHEILRQLKEEEPPRPSTKLEQDKATCASAAALRGLLPGELANALRGDLDCIAMKALEKDRNRRYGTPSDLATDLHRYLNKEPISARPASAGYRLQKFTARHKLGIASAIVIVAGLGVGLGVALWQAHVAQKETRTAEAVQTFLLDIFRANSIDQPDPVKGRQTTAAELLDIGAKKIDGALGDAPDAKLRVLEILGQMYDELELNEQAAAVARKRVQLAKALHGDWDPSVAQALTRLVVALRTSAAVDERNRALNEASNILDHNRDFTSRTRARVLVELANGCFDKDLPKALQLTQHAVKISQALPPDRDAVSALIQLGIFQTYHGELSHAEGSYDHALTALDAIRPATNHDRSQIYTYLGQTQRALQQFDSAERSQRLAFQVAQAVGGPNHQLTLIAQMDLGWFLFDTSRTAEGLAIMADAKERIVTTRGIDPQTVPYALNRYGRALLQYGRVEEGNEALAQAADYLRKYRPGSGYLATVLDLQSPGLTELGRYREARAAIEEAAQIHRNIHDDPIYVNENVLARADLLLATGNAPDAGKALDGFAMQESAPGMLSLTWVRGVLARSAVQLLEKKPGDAVEQASRVRKAVEQSPSRNYFKTYEAQAALAEGKGLKQQNRSADALPLLKRAVVLGSELYDRDRSLALASAQVELAECLIDRGEPAQARALLAEARAIYGSHRELGQQFTLRLRDLEHRISQLPGH